MTPATPPSGNQAPQRLADAALPRRVRQILDHVMDVASDELERLLQSMLTELEQQLFRLADHARNPGVESEYLHTLRTLRLNRADLVPRFMIGLEGSLANLGQSLSPLQGAPTGRGGINHDLSLIDNSEMDETLVLRDIAARHSSRASLELHLLGQRFGVLAASPAVDVERLPCSPYSLCTILRDAVEALQLPLDARLLLYRTFDRQVMTQYTLLVEMINAAMAADRLLPSLRYVPVRVRGSATPQSSRPPREQRGDGRVQTDATADDQEAVDAPQPDRRTYTEVRDPQRPHTGWLGIASDGIAGGAGGSGAGGGGSGGGSGGSSGAGGAAGGGVGGGSAGGDDGSGGDATAGTGGGGTSGRRASDGGSGGATGRRAGDVAAGSSGGRRAGDAPASKPDGAHAQDIDDGFELLRQMLAGRHDLLDKLRPGTAQGPVQTVARDEVLAALPRATPTGGDGSLASVADIKQDLLARLRQQRGQGAALSGEDNDTFELLDMLYGQIEREVRTDTKSASLLRRLQVPVISLALQNRAFFVQEDHPARLLMNAVAESGARWIDRNELDPQLMPALQDAVERVVRYHRDDPEVFTKSNDELQVRLHSIVHKAELAERRHIEAARGKEKLQVAKHKAIDTITELVGDQRPPHFVRALLNQAWADVLTLTLLRQGADSDEWKRKLETTRQIVENCCRSGQHAPDPALAAGIETALSQVGYHAEEAAAIARRLASSSDDENDPASRTELAMKLKARARLGEDVAGDEKRKLPPRTQEEQARYEYLRQLPFGTWIEFNTNQQGDTARRRLSWYSTITDNALFVNQRGQRVGEQTLDSVARLIVKGQARVVTAERARLIDRAWQATLNALRSFAGRSAPAGEPA